MMPHSDAVVLVKSRGAQAWQSREHSTVQLPGAAVLTWRLNPEPEIEPLSLGRSGLGRIDTWPSVSQPEASASCELFAKRSGRPVGQGLITRSASLYCPTFRP